MTSARRRARYVPLTASRVIASTLGTLPASVLVAAAIARFAPLSSPVAFALAYALWIPLWLAGVCGIACTRSAARAWLLCLAITLVAGACVLGIPH